MRRTTEFDEFGPWIYEVRSEEDVPRLFRTHPIDFESTETVLKVPRRIGRRDANPDMDLYENLIIAGSDSITVLTRRGDGYDTVEVPYGRIAAISSGVALLDGRLVIHDTEGREAAGLAVDVRYNGVSKEDIQRLVRTLCAKSQEAAGSGAASEMPQHAQQVPVSLRDLGDDDVELVTGVREISALDDEVVPAATHQRTVIKRRTGAFRWLLDKVRPVTLHAAVACVSPGELQVIHRREWFTVGRRPVHSVAHTVVPISRVTSVEVEDSSLYTVARVIRVTSGRSVVEIPFPAGAETGAAMLEALGASSD